MWEVKFLEAFRDHAKDIRNMEIIAEFCALLFDFHKGVAIY